MKKKLISVCLVVGLLCTCLTGCGKKTVNELFTSSQEVMSKSNSADVGFNMNIRCDMTEEDVTSSMGVSGDFNIKTENEKGAYFDGSMTLDMLGSKITQDVKGYSELGEENVTTYLYDKDNDSWVKSTSESSFNDLKDKFINVDYSSIYDKLVVSDKKEDLDGNQVYHVSGSISGNDLKDLVLSMKEVVSENSDDIDLSSLDETDLSALIINTDFYFDARTTMLVKASFDLTDSDLTKMVKDSLESDEDNEDSEEEEENFNMSFSACDFTLTFADGGDYKFEVPSDVKDNAVDSTDEEIDY